MKLRVLDGLLLIVVLVGGILAWRTGRERSRLEARYEHLAQVTGVLAITDPAKIHVRALETREPLHFAWRVYLPPRYNATVQVGDGSFTTFYNKDSSEFIARTRIRLDDQGLLQVYTSCANATSRMGLGDRALATLVREHRDQLRVEQLGSKGTAIIDPSRSAVMLRLALPEDLAAEARKALSPHDQRSLPVVFEWGFAPQAAQK